MDIESGEIPCYDTDWGWVGCSVSNVIGLVGVTNRLTFILIHKRPRGVSLNSFIYNGN